MLTPPGVSHQFFNEHDEPVKLFFVFRPSGEEKAIIDSVFQEVGRVESNLYLCLYREELSGRAISDLCHPR